MHQWCLEEKKLSDGAWNAVVCLFSRCTPALLLPRPQASDKTWALRLTLNQEAQVALSLCGAGAC